MCTTSFPSLITWVEHGVMGGVEHGTMGGVEHVGKMVCTTSFPPCGDLTHFSPKTLRFQVFYLKQRQSTNNQLDVHVYYERGLVSSLNTQAKLR